MNKTPDNLDNFMSRLSHILGTSEVSDMQRKLDIAYNTLRNYQRGRLPQTETLLDISNKTGASINWLLLGEGPIYRVEANNNFASIPVTTSLGAASIPVKPKSASEMQTIRIVIELPLNVSERMISLSPATMSYANGAAKQDEFDTEISAAYSSYAPSDNPTLPSAETSI